MRRLAMVLAAASLVNCGQNVFSINDDLLAYPQYEVVLSDQYISDTEADVQLASGASSLSATAKAASASSAAPLAASDLSPRPNYGAASPARSENKPESYERVILNSRPYLCSIPLVIEQETTNQTTDEQGKPDEEKELLRATHRGSELLKDMEGHCMYFVSGWWSYSFCYNNQVKQFHSLPPGKGIPVYPPVEDERVPAFILGQFQPPQKQVGSRHKAVENQESATWRDVAIKTQGEMRYMVQNLTGGTTCDLTGKPRKVEIQFHCHPQSSDRIGWIKETATCSYLMVIYTPRLCNDVAFLPPKETQAHQVVCKEVVKEEHIEEFRRRRQAETARKQLAESSREPTRPVVGGITVGGMKQVGQDGKRISPPKPVEQAEAQGEVIARWDPDKYDGRVQRLSDAELRKMELDPQAVNQMREELAKQAEGKAWKLEVVTLGPGIRELHGIVDGDDEDVNIDHGHTTSNGGRSPQDVKERQNHEDSEDEEGSQEVFKDEL